MVEEGLRNATDEEEVDVPPDGFDELDDLGRASLSSEDESVFRRFALKNCLT